MTRIITAPGELFADCEQARRTGKQVGFVPTMGALHNGHMSLADACRAAGAEHLVASIFVNPLQFGPSEDFDRYPRTFEADLALCQARSVDVVYAPGPGEMYPEGFQTKVVVEDLTKPLEGACRPNHFSGVTTVVLKLLNAVGPCVAAFGRKDYQQWRVIERLALDLNLPIRILGAPIARESDGLALSSRNRYLSADERRRALAIVQGLRAAYDAYHAGERDPARLCALAKDPVDANFDAVDYVRAVEPRTLLPCAGDSSPPVLLVAARVGTTRLIDNLDLGVDSRP